MNKLPVVTVSRADGGHVITCSCEFTAFRFSRVAADLVAHEHRGSHGTAVHPAWSRPRPQITNDGVA